jgi:hypothetical protein
MIVYKRKYRLMIKQIYLIQIEKIIMIVKEIYRILIMIFK